MMAMKIFLILVAGVLGGISASKPGARTISEVPHLRTYFYVGGTYVDDGAGGHVLRDQMYVEKLEPLNASMHDQTVPIVLIHGNAQTGTNFLNKPDGGRGWASDFVEQGYEVYVVDQTARGRSPWLPGSGAALPTVYSAEYIQQRFTAPEKNPIWPQAINHTQWPGTGTIGDPIFDAYYSSTVPFINNVTYQQQATQDAGAKLIDRIGKPVVLLGHSQAGIMATLIADARPELIRALVLLEPQGPPFQEAVFTNNSARPWGLADIPLTYSPAVTEPTTELVKETYPARSEEEFVPCILQAENPEPRKLTTLGDLAILVVTAEASYHATYDYCTVQYLKQAGCNKTEHLKLGEVGIHGNGHMLFLEENSHAIYDAIEDWIQSV